MGWPIGHRLVTGDIALAKAFAQQHFISPDQANRYTGRFPQRQRSLDKFAQLFNGIGHDSLLYLPG
jgi:hypothetical protein